MLENEEELNKEMKAMQEAEVEEAPENPEIEVNGDEITITEQKADDDQEQQEEKPQDKHWAIQAMHEERERRKEMAAQIQEERNLRAKMEERFEKFMASQEKQQEEEQRVDFDENPAEHLRQELQRANKVIEELQQGSTQSKEQQQAAIQRQQFQSHFEQLESEFREKTTDYDAAVEFMRNKRQNEYIAMGLSQSEAVQATMNDAWNIAANAASRGKNGAQVFYDLAKANGYQKSADPKDGGNTSELEKLNEIARGQEKAQSLGSQGDTPQKISLADLANLPDDEFDKFTSGDNWEKLAGA